MPTQKLALRPLLLVSLLASFVLSVLQYLVALSSTILSQLCITNFSPARVFGANVVSGDFGQSWVYYVGDFLGGACGALLQLAFATTHVMQENPDKAQPIPTTIPPGEEEPAVHTVSLDDENPAGDHFGGVPLKAT